MKSLYRSLLRLYPYDYRSTFGAEMFRAFEAAAAERQRKEGDETFRFVIRELWGILAGAAAEWTSKATTSRSMRARSVPDLRRMRPAGVTKEVWFAHAGEYKD